MYEFATGRMPSYLTRVNGVRDLAKFAAKADKYALPKILVVSKEPRTSIVSKSLSTTFRRRALFAEVRATKPNKEIVAKLGLDSWLGDSSSPKTVVVALRGEGTEGDAIPMKKKGDFVKFKQSIAEKFIFKVAFKKPYFEDEAAQAILEARKVSQVDDQQDTEEQETSNPKKEL